MKRVLSIIIALLVVVGMSATNLAGKRIYVNPGHGSFGPNDRPMATIPYPNLSSTGMPDTCGFYESNTNLWKCQYLRDRLVEAGATVVMSREACGPWPYEKDANGQYPDYWYYKSETNPATHPNTTAYNKRSDYEMYNKPLSTICEEVESGNYDLFISVHSNADTDGSATNYPIWLYRGYDAATTTFEQNCKAFGAAMWPYRFEPMTEGFDHKSYYSATNMALRGDVSFMGESKCGTSTRSNGNQYYGYYGVLKHGTVGGIFEGYFHTYQPARHRALNKDCCRMEGYCYYRGIVDYFNADKDNKGYILGLIKDEYEKISSNPLYTYAPKMHDQWLPLNGAVVSLYKAGVKIAEYTVDNCYNGVFYFGDLEPGNDYTLDATCEGYKPMWEQYKAPITVTANKVTYPRIYLESESHESEVEQPKTYEEPELPAYVELASKYTMREVFVSEKIRELRGKTIRRAIVRDDNTMFVLAIDSKNEPYLYLINPTTQEVKATLPTDFCTVSAEGKLKLSDIAVTAEGVLVGCNEEKVTYTPSNKLQIYKWTETAGEWSGAVWFDTTNNETAGNYLNAIAGSTMAYAGTLDDGALYFTAYTIGSETHGVRYICYSIAADTYAGAFRNQDASHTLSAMGHDIQFNISPKADSIVMITAGNIAPMEWKTVATTTSAPIITNMPAAFKGAKGITYFKYAQHQLMVMPADNRPTGVAMYDITKGVDQPKEVAIEVEDPTMAEPAVAFAVVNEGEISIYHDGKDGLTKLTTAGVDQPVVAGVYAYALDTAHTAEGLYTLSFVSNDEAMGRIIFYDNNGAEAGSYPIASVVKGLNHVAVPAHAMPGAVGDTLTWAVELTGKEIANWGLVHSDNSMVRTNTTRVFNTVDKNPLSPYFGRIYIMRRAGSSASAERPYNGIYVYNPDYTLAHADLLKGGQNFGNPARLAIDEQGYVYQSDWADGNSGVFVIDPANITGSFTQFFQGTRASSGLFDNNGVKTGSSTPGIGIYGKGADTKLIVYNEDAGGTLPANGLAIYNIGQPDGSIVRTWGEAPSSVIPLTMQANTEGTPVGTSHGVFVSQVRSSGNNNSAAPSLLFMDYAGTMQMSSHQDPYNDIIDGSDGGGYAISEDESMLVLQGGQKQFYVFDIAWEGNKPILTLRYEYKHGVQTIRQMNFDYAGNLVCTGESGIHIFSMPHPNTRITPANKEMIVVKENSIPVTGVTLDKAAVTLDKGATETLEATIAPADATLKEVVWESVNPTIAKVAAGVVTAIRAGETAIIVKTVDGNFADTCIVTVNPTPVTGVELSEITLEMMVGETEIIDAIIAPLDATNKDVIWSSSNDSLATVVDGVISALAEGEVVITVSTVDGEFTATCAVTISPAIVESVTDIADDGLSYSNHTIQNSRNLQLMVFSAQGQMVATGRGDISLEAMPAGVYVVRTPSGNVLKVLR